MPRLAFTMAAQGWDISRENGAVATCVGDPGFALARCSTEMQAGKHCVEFHERA